MKQLTSPTFRKVVPLALIVLILIVGTAARFHLIGAQSLWHDEGASYGLAVRSIPETARFAAVEVHVPLYFWGLHLWMGVAGESEFSLRLFSAFGSLLGIAMAYTLGRKLFGTVAGLAAAAFILFNTFSIHYAQEVRMYAWMTFIAGLGFWLLVHFVEKRTWRWAVGLAAVNFVGMFTHYSYVFIMLGQGVMAVLWLGALVINGWRQSGWRSGIGDSGDLLWRYVALNLLTLLLYTPWILSGGVAQIGVHPNIAEAVPLIEMIRLLHGWFAFGMTFEQNMGSMGVIALILLLFGLLILPENRRDKWAWWKMALPAVWVIVGVAAYQWLGLYERYLRFLLPLQIGFALWMGRGIWILWRIQTRERTGLVVYVPRLAAVVAVGALLVNMSHGLDPLYHDPAYQRDDFRSMAQTITQQARNGDAIILDGPALTETFHYYYDGYIPVYPLPLSTDDDQTAADTRAVIADYDRIFVLFWGMEQQDPNYVVETVLSQEAYQIDEQWVGDVRFVRYVTPADFPSPTESGAQFGDHITLTHYALSSRTIEAGGALQIQLHWTTDDTLTVRYKVFVQILNPDGTLAAQRDSEPGGGLLLTTQWQTDETVIDQHAIAIPAELPAGEYTVIVGLYDANDPSARLPVGEGDFLILGTVRLNAPRYSWNSQAVDP